MKPIGAPSVPTRCPACGRRPARLTARIQACDYCDSTWQRTPGGPSAFAASPQARWAIRAASAPGGRSLRTSLSLGILASRTALTDAFELARYLSDAVAETVIVIDADEVPRTEAPPRTRVRARPLAGHFGAQRTALQRSATAPWMLQLDTDEIIARESLARLPAVLLAAERAGILALGLPRRNHVDGAMSDHYPDPQYRLCRRSVAYEGRVHERPRLLSRARQSRLALGLHIDHYLDAGRVRARTQRYGAMSDGATDTARQRDERALLTPFCP